MIVAYASARLRLGKRKRLKPLSKHARKHGVRETFGGPVIAGIGDIRTEVLRGSGVPERIAPHSSCISRVQ